MAAPRSSHRRRKSRTSTACRPSVESHVATSSRRAAAIACRAGRAARRGRGEAAMEGRFMAGRGRVVQSRPAEAAVHTIFVMVKCELGRAYEVAAAAADRVDAVSEVYSTLGQYDLLLKCVLPAGSDAGHFVTESLQTLSGVRDTFTIIAFKAF